MIFCCWDSRSGEDVGEQRDFQSWENCSQRGPPGSAASFVCLKVLVYVFSEVITLPLKRARSLLCGHSRWKSRSMLEEDLRTLLS